MGPLGKRQARLLGLAERSTYKIVRATGYLDRRALRRLEARGIVKPALGSPGCWSIA